MITPAILAAIVAVIVGFLPLWANPRRTLAQVFFSASLHAALWLLLREISTGGGPTGQMWLRISMATGALLPAHLWIIKETIVAGRVNRIRGTLRAGAIWLLPCSAIAAITFSEWFVPTQTVSRVITPFGNGFKAYTAGLIVLYCAIGYQALRQMQIVSGVSKLELQTVLLGGTGAALGFLSIMAIGTVYSARWLANLKILLVLAFYTATAISITTTRIFDARQLMHWVFKYLSLAITVAIFAAILFELTVIIFPRTFSFLFTILSTLGLALLLDHRLDRLFRFYSSDTEARQAAFAVAQCESRPEPMTRSFRDILAGWGHCERAIILSGSKALTSECGISLDRDSPIISSLRTLRWATPERLSRERRTSERIELDHFLADQNLGLVVLEEGQALFTIIGLAPSASRRPYTFPQVEQLRELTHIIEGALERAHFHTRALQGEQLATVGLLGASLAHEIRNPLVSIKTFVQLLPKHYQDPIFREKFFTLMTDEVNRIDQLTEQLLDLSTPRLYVQKNVAVHQIVHSALDLLTGKAAHANIILSHALLASPDGAFTDSSAIKQVIINLCLNAIQAIDSGSSAQRWIHVSTKNIENKIEISIADSGPGISEEMRVRLFQPFQTNKSKGFGLGLAICNDILTNLQAEISADPPVIGQGATFRVLIPCQQSLC